MVKLGSCVRIPDFSSLFVAFLIASKRLEIHKINRWRGTIIGIFAMFQRIWCHWPLDTRSFLKFFKDMVYILDTLDTPDILDTPDRLEKPDILDTTDILYTTDICDTFHNVAKTLCHKHTLWIYDTLYNMSLWHWTLCCYDSEPYASLGHMLVIMEWIHFHSFLYSKTLKKSFCNLIWTILPYENIKSQFWKSWDDLEWGPTLHCDRAKNKKERTLLLSNEKEQHYCFKGNCISCFWKKVELHDHNFHNKMSKSHCTDE